MQENQFWNQFETYLHDHRDELDVETPRAEVWDRIAGELGGRARPLWQQAQVWRVAAVIAIALGLSYWWYSRPSNPLPQMGADIGAGQQDWKAVAMPQQAEIDSLRAVAGSQADDMPAVQQAQRRIDSLEAVGAPTPERIELYHKLQQQQVEALRHVTQ